MPHRIYLDTHMIDYLWDHRALIWENKPGSLLRVRVRDASPQIEEYEALEGLPEICYFSDWRLVVGERVIAELLRIRNGRRRQSLLDYAVQLAGLSCLDLQEQEEASEDHEGETSLDRCPAHPSQLVFPGFEDCYCSLEHTAEEAVRLGHGSTEKLVEDLPASDRPLVAEAIELGCDVFLTTDARLVRRGHALEGARSIRIRTLTGLLEEALGPDGCCTRTAPRYYPDLLLYTGMMPGNPY